MTIKIVPVMKNSPIINSVVFCAVVHCFHITNATAQSFQEGVLPEPLIHTECVITNPPYWGWDGEQSCTPSNTWFEGAEYPLSSTGSDSNGDNLAWDRVDFENKTVRCDVFTRSYRADSGYEKEIYDTTFLESGAMVIDPAVTQLGDATAHIYNNSWTIGINGRLERVLMDFNSREFTTSKGYIFIYDTQTSRLEPEKRIATHFGHCYLRDESIPLRASKYCVDYDGDGVGWNGTETCSIQVINPDCDYSQALLGSNQGWGYNVVTGRSCPPLTDTAYQAEDECTRVNEDGWGWNAYRQESCQI